MAYLIDWMGRVAEPVLVLSPVERKRLDMMEEHAWVFRDDVPVPHKEEAFPVKGIAAILLVLHFRWYGREWYDLRLVVNTSSVICHVAIEAVEKLLEDEKLRPIVAAAGPEVLVQEPDVRFVDIPPMMTGG